MTAISIFPFPNADGSQSYRAISGNQFSVGNSPGEALDQMALKLGTTPTNTVVLLQRNQPDEFFTAEQQTELQQLMDRWRAARDQGREFSEEEQAKLDALIELELIASGKRAAKLADEIGS